MFDLIIKHGHFYIILDKGLLCILIRINLKTQKDAKNYRLVVIVTILSNYLKRVYLQDIKDKFYSSRLQFRFVQGDGCDRYIFTLSNLFYYYLERSSDVHFVSLDATAFNRLNTYELISVLIKLG